MTQPVFIIAIIATVIVSYFIGNISFADIVSRVLKADIRSKGSGNPGTVNMIRNVGLKAGAVTLVLDILKGAIPVIAAYFLFMNNGDWFIKDDIVRSSLHPFVYSTSEWYAPLLGFYLPGVSKVPMYIAGLSVIIGHIYPAVLKFKGGKGAASTIGVFLAASPVIGFFLLMNAIGYLFVGKYGSVTSFIFTIGMTVIETVVIFVFKDHYSATILILLICAFVLFAHRSNIVRLIKGTESDSNLSRRIRETVIKKEEARKTAEAPPEENNEK